MKHVRMLPNEQERGVREREKERGKREDEREVARGEMKKKEKRWEKEIAIAMSERGEIQSINPKRSVAMTCP